MSRLQPQLVVLRQEAIDRGLRRYFTGEECLKGHVAERWTRNGGCVLCEEERKVRERRRIEEGLAKAANLAAEGR
jgi:hypothetical protein